MGKRKPSQERAALYRLRDYGRKVADMRRRDERRAANVVKGRVS
jgi:hypothetical protein